MNREERRQALIGRAKGAIAGLQGQGKEEVLESLSEQGRRLYLQEKGEELPSEDPETRMQYMVVAAALRLVSYEAREGPKKTALTLLLLRLLEPREWRLWGRRRRQE